MDALIECLVEVADDEKSEPAQNNKHADDEVGGAIKGEWFQIGAEGRESCIAKG